MDKNIKGMLKELKKEFRGGCRVDEPLCKHTTFRIGGPASLWVEPKDTEDLQLLMRFISRHKMPFFILGGGSNILVKDKGFAGIVVHLDSKNDKNIKLKEIDNKRLIIESGSAVRIKNLLDFCRSFSLSGLEFMTGIPARLGGSLMMNAGIGSSLKDNDSPVNIGDLVEEVKVIDSRGEIHILDKEKLQFGYRYSNLSKYIILSAKLRLRKDKKENIAKRCDELLEHRKKSQEIKFPSCGSVFKNPSLAEFKKSRFKIDTANLTAGRLIDLCGLKGKRIGGAQISLKHANFIVNTGEASAEDVLSLIKLIKGRVEEKIGVMLKLEVRII